MQGGGTGFNEPQFLLNHFSDYSVWDMQDYLEQHVVVWNESLNSYASWNQNNADYTNTVSNNGVQYPVVRDVDVITVMASILGSDPDVNMVYPPIGPYEGDLIDLFDPRNAGDRAEARQDYGFSQDFDVSLRIIQGGVEKIYMLPANYDSTLRTEAVNLPAADGEVARVELLLTPDAQVNGLPADPQVLDTWSVMPDPASFGLAPLAVNSTLIVMSAGFQGPVEYLFTETSGNPGGTSSGWQSSPSYTDTGLQPGTQYTYTVTMRAGYYTGSPSAPASATTPAAVVDRHVFYNDSEHDGNNPAADAADDAAIDPTKAALLPGQAAGSANTTGYSKGVNGVMVDIAGLPLPASLLATDFEIRAGADGDPALWPVAAGPTDIAVREGAGTDGSHRVTLIWPNGSFTNTWVQVTVKATSNTGAVVDDVFYFGNVPGDSDGNRTVDITDFNTLASNFDPSGANPGNSLSMGDFDLDGDIDITDFNTLASNFSPAPVLELITAAAGALPMLPMALLAEERTALALAASPEPAPTSDIAPPTDHLVAIRPLQQRHRAGTNARDHAAVNWALASPDRRQHMPTKHRAAGIRDTSSVLDSNADPDGLPGRRRASKVRVLTNQNA